MASQTKLDIVDSLAGFRTTNAVCTIQYPKTGVSLNVLKGLTLYDRYLSSLYAAKSKVGIVRLCIGIFSHSRSSQ